MINLPPGKIQDTLTIFFAIVIEATPFIVLGVLVSVLIKAFLSDEKLLKIRPKNPFASHFVMSLLGMAFPVCECGNVPLLRQLVTKKVPISAAVSFYLGAPILNIAVITSTFIAFSGNNVILIGRFFLGFLIAYLTGLFLHFFVKTDESVLTEHMNHLCEKHDHEHHEKRGIKFIFSKKFVNFFNQEMKSMFVLLIVGAFIASLTQIWIPRDVLLSLNSSPILAILAMMFLAVIISVCSTVDAFIALGFSQTFSSGALLSFLLYGPMIDIKALSMLSTTFKVKFLVKIVSIVTLLTILFSLFVVFLGY